MALQMASIIVKYLQGT